ncbi:MAG: hypothetical protein HY674_20015 [Chloroflexi bacterium]|nr:hypothetical protein [Chloroflexota bacterium]
MSVQEIEEHVRQLPPDELRRFAEWWERYRDLALLQPPKDSAAPSDESEAVRQELLARQCEYHEFPKRFVRMDEKDLDQMFHEINEEVRQQTSARPS